MTRVTLTMFDILVHLVMKSIFSPSGNGPQEEKGCSQNGNSWRQKAAGLSEETGSEQHRRDRRGEPSKGN